MPTKYTKCANCGNMVLVNYLQNFSVAVFSLLVFGFAKFMVLAVCGRNETNKDNTLQDRIRPIIL